MSTSVGHSQLTLTSEPEKFRNPPWWNRRTKLERTLCFVTVTSLLMLAVMAAALAVFGYLYQRNIDSRQTIFIPPNTERLVSSNISTTNLCLTPGCVKAAAEVLSNLDENVDPCDDFYRFACGGWLNRHAISEDKSSVSVFSEVQDDLNLKLRVLLEKKLDGSEAVFTKMIKDMYDTCMDMKSIEKSGADPLKKVLKDLGGWPVVEGSKWEESNFDWVEALIAFRKLGYSHDILLDLSVTADYRNNTVHIIDLDQTSLGMPDRTYLVRGLNDSATAAYYQLMVKSAKLLGADEGTVEKELLKALHFEMALANNSLPREERRNISKLYNKYTVKQLQDEVPEIPWLKYFNGLLNNEIYENETLILSVPVFIRNFSDIIKKTEKRVVANYMLWRVVAQSLSILSKEWRDIAHEYSSAITGKSQEEPRWEQCLSSLTGSLGIALSSYYVRHYFKEESKDTALELVKYIHKEFLHILDEIDWMDELTKKQAKDKANTIKSYIGYPKELLNDSAVSELYENLTITSESYFGNIMKLRKWSTDYAFSQLRKPNIRGEWKKHARAAVVNAFYNSLENSIEFPAGILQNAFFNKDRPHYMNFGAIGYVIGHEITHGFDDRGRQFDKDGNNVNWWDKKTDELFKKKSQCIIDQYSNYTAENGMKVNGINTQGENIADNGGLKEAYWAYHSWVKDNGQEQLLPGLKYSQSQMFWISAANVWCGKYRPEVLKLRIISGSHSPPQFRKVSWLKTGTKLERILCFVSVASLLVIAVMTTALAFLGYLYNNKTDLKCQSPVLTNAVNLMPSEKYASNICLTPGCVKAAALLLANLNESVDPCSDFYQFACGAWLKKTSIPEDKAVVTIYYEAVDNTNLQIKLLLEKNLDGTEPSSVKMTKELYDTCVDTKAIEEAGSEPLKKVIRSLGGWPVVEGRKWIKKRFDWVDAIISLRNLGYNHDILLSLSVIIDYRSSDRYIIQLDQPSFGMPHRNYLIDGLNDTATAAYYKQMVKAAVLLGANEATAKKELLESLEFERTLANVISGYT